MNKAERSHIESVVAHGCIIDNPDCSGRITYHHCGTSMGGGRDHFLGIGLCWAHHLGPEGIDGKKMGKRIWEQKYGSEEALLEKTNKLLGRI